MARHVVGMMQRTFLAIDENDGYSVASNPPISENTINVFNKIQYLLISNRNKCIDDERRQCDCLSFSHICLYIFTCTADRYVQV